MEAAIGRVEARAESGRRLLNQVNAQFRRIPNISLTAEAAVGLVLASSTAGNLILGTGVAMATFNTDLLEQAVNDGARAGARIYGELHREALDASALHGTFKTQYAEFSAANRMLKNAMRAGDHGAIIDLTKRMEAQELAMRGTASALEGKMTRVDKLNREFDQAAIHAAVELAVKAVTWGMGAMPGEHLVRGLAGRDIAMQYGLATESAVAGVIAGAIHVAHETASPHEAARGSVTGRAADAMRVSR